MIHTIRTVAVGDQESKIDSPIILYRGDREVEVEFTINGSKFTFTNGGNVIKSTNATHGQLVINTPTGENMFSEVTECHDGKVVFVITKEMIDELIEVGFYSFQIRLFDESQVSRVTIPPVLKGIDIRNPIAAEDETNVVDIGLVDYAVVVKDEFEDLSTFLPDGNYNKTEWESKDVISGAKLNKIEDALYNINSNIEATDLALLKRIDDINTNLNYRINDLKASDISLLNRIDNINTNLSGDIARLDGNVQAEIENVMNRESISVDDFGAVGDGVTDDTEAFQNCFDYCNDNGYCILVPNKSYFLNNPIVLKEHGTYHIKGCNTSMLDGSRVKSKSLLIPNSILFKGGTLNNNTTVYMTLQDLRIYPKTIQGYTKDGTYIFYDLNLYGLLMSNVTIRNIDIFSRGYISKASVINNIRVSFVKTALFEGNEYNQTFMADSQITNCYFTGAYPVTLFNGRAVNTTISNCFLDYFKFVQDSRGFANINFRFCENTIGIFYRWFADDCCRGHVDIINNTLDHISNEALIQAASTNFVTIDDDMRNGVAGPFVATTWQENIYGYKTDKCKVHGNRFTACDNIFTRSNGIMQVTIKDNTFTDIKNSVCDLSFRDTTSGVDKYGEFYCDWLDNQVVSSLPTIRNGNNVYVFEGQKCILDGVEYQVINEKWVSSLDNNRYDTTEIKVGMYNGKHLYRKVVTGNFTIATSGFKNINFPEAETLFFISSHSYWGDMKIQFNNIPKTGVYTDSIACMTWHDTNAKRLMLYNNSNKEITFNFVITVEYTKA